PIAYGRPVSRVFGVATEFSRNLRRALPKIAGNTPERAVLGNDSCGNGAFTLLTRPERLKVRIPSPYWQGHGSVSPAALRQLGEARNSPRRLGSALRTSTPVRAPKSGSIELCSNA